MVLERQRQPLRPAELPEPTPGPGQILISVHACGVCRTDLHIADGELSEPKLPLVMGHQIVGTVVGAGEGAERFSEGERVGVPWLGWVCGECRYCRGGRENLCDRARFTGYDLDGGYAELAVADERFCFSIPEGYSDEQAAPLLCAGLIGYRALRLVGDAERIGLYGFGASAHILCQVAAHQGRRVFAFTREGDEEGQAFARELGAEWAGSSQEAPPEGIDGAIVFAPVGALMTTALRASAKGARIISAGIHMSDIPAFPYEQLWGERVLGSVANLTREDGEEFMALAPRIPIRTQVEVRPLEEANEALDSIRDGSLRGAAVLSVAGPQRNRSSARGREIEAAPGPSSSVTKRSRPRTMTAGMWLSLLRTRSAAAAASSATAIRVASSF
jgi:propanol-preferring alcohol dehydrogenase